MATRKSSQPKVRWSVAGKPLALQVGMRVLCGGTAASYPNHWYLGEVLWFDADNVVLKRCAATGQAWTQMISILEIRAFGAIAELMDVRKQAIAGVKDLQAAVDEAESALGRAREALFARLEDLCARELRAIPLNLPAIKAEEGERRAAHEKIESEDAALAKSLVEGG